MTTASLTQRVRRMVHDAFRRFGHADTEIDETILIRDGNYCGRRFDGGDLRAVWFVEERELKVYGAEGAVIYVCSTEDVFGQLATGKVA